MLIQFADARMIHLFVFVSLLQALQDEVEGQMDTVDAMRKAGNDMISQSSPGDPYVRGKILNKLSPP